MTATIRTNIPDFRRQLRRLDTVTRRRVVARAVAAGARVFRDAARAAAPVDSGRLRRGIYVKSVRVRNAVGTEKAASVKIKSGARYRSVGKRGKNNDAYYARFVIRGHIVRGPGQKLQGGRRSRELQRSRLRRSGAREVPPNKFLSRAFAASRGRALSAFNDKLSSELALASSRIR